MDKRANAIPVAIFMIGTMALSFFTIGYFLIKQGDIEEVFEGYSEIDKLYEQELLLDFYLKNIFDRASRDISFISGKQVFIDRFRVELRKYIGEDGRYPIDELASVDIIISDPDIVDYVDIDENGLRFRLEVEISRFGSADNLVLRYKYVKVFEKVFK